MEEPRSRQARMLNSSKPVIRWIKGDGLDDPVTRAAIGQATRLFGDRVQYCLTANGISPERARRVLDWAARPVELRMQSPDDNPHLAAALQHAGCAPPPVKPVGLKRDTRGAEQSCRRTRTGMVELHNEFLNSRRVEPIRMRLFHRLQTFLSCQFYCLLSPLSCLLSLCNPLRQAARPSRRVRSRAAALDWLLARTG